MILILFILTVAWLNDAKPKRAFGDGLLMSETWRTKIIK